MIIKPESIIAVPIILILMLFTVLLFSVGKHIKSNVYLGIYFVSQIVALFNMYFLYHPTLIFCLVQSVVYSWGAFYYLFIVSLLNPAFRFKRVYLFHFVSVPVGAFLSIISLYPPTSSFFESNFPSISNHSQLLQNLLFNFLIVGYNVATVVKYYQYRSDVKQGCRQKNPVQPVWLNLSIWGFVISCFLTQIGNYLERVVPNTNFNWNMVGLTAFLVYFCILFYVAVASRILTEHYEVKEKYKHSNLSEMDAMQLLAGLDEMMKQKRPFTNPDLKLKDLSDLLKTSERNLSQLINRYKCQNFPDYINSFRLDYAKEMLADPLLKEKTILWILYEAGFNSKTAFNTTFKKNEGCTPVEFRKKSLKINI